MEHIGELLPWVGTAGAWAWATFGKDISTTLVKNLLEKTEEKVSDQVVEAAKAVWERVDWKLAARKYNLEMRNQYGWTRVIGQTQPVPLEGIFTDVFILDKPTAFQRFNIRALQSDPEYLDQEKNRFNGLELIRASDAHRLYILGKPGAGKTTFLRYITLQATLGHLDKIPIFVSLKSWADSGLELMDFLYSQFAICSFPDAEPFVAHILEKGKAVTLFDGLDEVNQEAGQREKVIDAIRSFSYKYSKSQCLITCRIAAIDYTFEQFKYVELADFTPQQIKAYVSKWFQDKPEKRRKFFEEFSKEENKRLRELAKVPLLLGLLCLSFDATMTFPQRRVEIYSEALEALLKKWDASRSIKRDEIYRGLTPGRKSQMFARIAAQTFQANKYFLQQNELAKLIVSYLKQLPDAPAEVDIDGDAVLKAIEAQHGIFTERAANIYSFSHLTFQEYFTAKHVVEDTSGHALRGLLKVENISDSRWREVILLTASLLDDADIFFKLFKKAVDNMVKDEPAINKLLNAAQTKLQNTEINYKVAAVRAYYCYQSLSLYLAINLAQDPEIIRALDFDRSILRAPTLDLTIVQSQAQDLADDLERARARVISVGRVSKDGRGRDQFTLEEDKKRIRNLQYALGLVRARDQSRLLARSIDINITQAGAFEPGHALDLDRNLSNLLLFSIWFEALPSWSLNQKNVSKFKVYLMKVYKQAQESGQLKSADLLNSFTPLFGDFNAEARAKLKNGLRELLTKQRNISYDIHLEQTQYKKLTNYFAANQLLLDCLKLAVVSNRQTIEESLLLPPR